MTDWGIELETLSEVGIRNSHLEEIRNLSADILLQVDNREPPTIYCEYWLFNPSLESIKLRELELSSKNTKMILKAFKLLDKVAYFIEKYQPNDLKILVENQNAKNI